MYHISYIIIRLEYIFLNCERLEKIFKETKIYLENNTTIKEAKEQYQVLKGKYTLLENDFLIFRAQIIKDKINEENNYKTN